MLKLENINKYFNKNRRNQIHVIDNTTLEFKDNGLVAFLGPSGSGKTTLLNIIGGLDHFGSGNLIINDKKITKFNYCKMDKIRNLSIGYIFQDYKLIDNMTVYDNIALVLKMIGIKDKEEIRKRVTFVLEATGIYRYRNRMANMLSGGERQRVGIARALVKNPDIILADEPTGNLDSKNSIEVMNIIKAISKDRLVILVTHEVTLANFYADRIIQIQDGKVISDKKNKDVGDLDYRIENKIYLKDFANHNKLKNDDLSIDVYSDKKEKRNISIVFKNGNIYIQSDDTKIEVLDNDSSIELVNDHYKKINQEEISNYSFDLDKIVDKNIKLSDENTINDLLILLNGLDNIRLHTLIKNNENKYISDGYILEKVNVTFDEISLYDIGVFNSIVLDDMSKYVDMNSFWYNKIDYIENQIHDLSSNVLINNSVDYYIGISELILSNLKNHMGNSKITLSHKFLNNLSTLEYYNPLNISYDVWLKDICYYVKYKNDYEYIEKIK